MCCFGQKDGGAASIAARRPIKTAMFQLTPLPCEPAYFCFDVLIK